MRLSRIIDPKINWAISNYDLKDNIKTITERMVKSYAQVKKMTIKRAIFYKLDLRPMPLVMIIPVFIMTMSH